MPEFDKLHRLAKQLKDKKGTYWPPMPLPDIMGWLLRGGQCVYCDTPLVEIHKMINRLGETDHLLPKGKYKKLLVKAKYENLTSDPRNLVPACSGCNSLKRHYDPNTDGPELYNPENESHISEDIQEQLITRARKHVNGERQTRHATFQQDQANWFEALKQWRTHSL